MLSSQPVDRTQWHVIGTRLPTGECWLPLRLLPLHGLSPLSAMTKADAKPAAATTAARKRKSAASSSASSSADFYGLDFAALDFRQRPELYRVGRGEQGVLLVQPYKSELLPTAPPATLGHGHGPQPADGLHALAALRQPRLGQKVRRAGPWGYWRAARCLHGVAEGEDKYQCDIPARSL